MSRLTRFVAVSLIGVALVAGPAATAANAGVIDYGAIARCRYEVTQAGTYGWTEALLRKIGVQPPTVPKKPGSQSVGWRFIVERSLDRNNPPWVVTFRSRIQRAASSAAFTPMRVAVAVPSDVEDRAHVWYHVTLKMFWYRSDGSVLTKLSHGMNDMYVVVDGEEVVDSYCQGLAQQWFD